MSGDPAILFLTKYGRRGPSSRYRVFQYIPYLEARGFRCDVQSLHDDGYLEALFAGSRRSVFYYASRLRGRARAVAAARDYAVVFVQKELAPFVPPILERRLAAARVPVVYDIDDAVFLAYERSRNPVVRLMLGGKIREAFSLATVVLAGNDYLAAHAARANPNSVYFPTVVDPAKYDRARRAARGISAVGDETEPVIAWIGTPETARFLGECRGALEEAWRRHRFLLRIIGAGEPAAWRMRIESIPWSEDTEADALARSDIGIMPLPADEWARGKCGLKLLQYMASSLPVVASPAGGAERIVAHGETGFLARSRDEWFEYLLKLIERPALRREMGERALARVRAEWSLEVWAPRMADVLSRCVRGESLKGLAW